jgi:hypothetical protein
VATQEIVTVKNFNVGSLMLDAGFVDTWGGEMEEMSSLWRGVGALRRQSGRQVLPPGGECHVGELVNVHAPPSPPQLLGCLGS